MLSEIHLRNKVHCFWCPSLIAVNMWLTCLTFNDLISKSYILSSLLCFQSLFVYFTTKILFHQKFRFILLTYLLSLLITIPLYARYVQGNFGLFSLILFCNGTLILWSVYNLPILFPQSFSLCELLIVCQGGTPVISQSLGCFVTRLLHLQNESYCSIHEPTIILQCFILVFFLLLLTLKQFDKIRKTSFGCYAVLVLTNLFIYVLIWNYTQKEPLNWLLIFIFSTKNRMKLFLIWIICLSVCLTFAIITVKVNASKRKFFHIVFDVIFIVGLKKDIEFLYFACASMLYICLITEVIRVLNVPPFATYIQKSFETFRDEKDIGILTLTHLYLLAGVCLPLWMYPSFNDVHNIHIASGLIATGFGDTAAAFFGSRFGKHKWPFSQKSYEGSVAAFVAQFLGAMFLFYYLDLNISVFEIVIIAFASMFTCVIEALTQQIDNLLIPLYFNAFLLFASQLNFNRN